MSQQPCLLLLLLPSIPWARILHKNPQPKSFSRTSHLKCCYRRQPGHSCCKVLLLVQYPLHCIRSSRILSGTLLYKVSDELKSQMKHCLKDQTVTLVEDGWSNIRNNPILATTVQKRFKPSSHLVAYLLHPDYRGSRLINELRELAYQWLIEKNSPSSHCF